MWLSLTMCLQHWAGENLPLVQKGLCLSAKQSFLLQPLICIQSFSKFRSLLMSVVSHFGM